MTMDDERTNTEEEEEEDEDEEEIGEISSLHLATDKMIEVTRNKSPGCSAAPLAATDFLKIDPIGITVFFSRTGFCFRWSSASTGLLVNC